MCMCTMYVYVHYVCVCAGFASCAETFVSSIKPGFSFILEMFMWQVMLQIVSWDTMEKQVS
jgi:hypothetical protein